MKARKVIISGGGTAGHLFPALAVAQKIKEKDPEVLITFVGGDRELEKKIMQHHKSDFIALKIEGLKGKGWKSLKSLLLLPFSFLRSFVILMRKRPNLVVGVGGYSSGPIVLLAAWLRIPTLIMEQNRHPGLTNRMLLPWVKKAVAAFAGTLPEFKGKGEFLGNPVREEFYNLSAKSRNSKLSLLIFGGSQGSHFLNRIMVEALKLLHKEKDNLMIFHQTGPKDCEWVKKNYLNNEFKDAVIAPFFHNMAEYFQKSDLIICRAGATSIAELIAARKAAILIPFAQAADDHQTQNAQELGQVEGAEIIPEKELTSAVFTKKILGFLENKETINRMEKNLQQLSIENSAGRISELCFQLMDRRKKKRKKEEEEKEKK